MDKNSLFKIFKILLKILIVPLALYVGAGNLIFVAGFMSAWFSKEIFGILFYSLSPLIYLYFIVQLVRLKKWAWLSSMILLVTTFLMIYPINIALFEAGSAEMSPFHFAYFTVWSYFCIGFIPFLIVRTIVKIIKKRYKK